MCCEGHAGQGVHQTFDAFGNSVGESRLAIRCNEDHDRGEWTAARLCTLSSPPVLMASCEADDLPSGGCDGPVYHDDSTLWAADCPDPLPDATPVARVQSGDFNWRGGEGSMTDRVGREHRRWRDPDEVRYNAWTRPSTC